MTTTQAPPPRPGAMDPASFTQERYRQMLTRTIALQPVGFEIVLDPLLAQKRFCIIRHDIDMSVDTALEIARLETELGVRATYMVLLSGKFYNPFEADVRDQIVEVRRLGHEIALHFDASLYGISEEGALGDAIAWEAAILGGLLGGEPIRVFSFHVNTDFTMSCRQPSYGGLINAYAGVLQDNVSYVSDSSGYWRFNTWQEMLDTGPQRLQVLTHPEWWAEPPTYAAEKVCRHLDRRSREGWRWHAELQRAGNRENPTHVPEALSCLLAGSEEEQAILYQWLSGYRRGAYAELLALTLPMIGGSTATGTIRDAARMPRDDLGDAFEELVRLRRNLQEQALETDGSA